jgi:eukaryotic-like serine/threonine-protein kinase
MEERWEQADRIFDEALDHPAAERPSFLAEACGGDDALRALVERLLADAETLDAFLSPSGALAGAVGRTLAETMGDGDPPAAGTAVGRYRLGPELGRGGMAVVYLAERSDGLYAQKVAVKLVKRGSDTDEVLRRFEQERRILASLTHPGIARILDGGAAADGRPYFAMEYVEGRPIDAWCDERKLPLAARLRLFVRVARAVEHAHHNLVVHRDLKPSNILVTPAGHPKLLDFGIAKLLEDAGASDITGSDVRVLTPAYASPELIKGEPVTTASDVYQLGLLLYILLTGRHPYRGARDSAASLTRAILEDEPPRPSQAVLGDGGASASPGERAQARGLTPDRLARALSGDLDTIVLAALRKDPEQRYGDVGQLVDDVERHLAFEPVKARQAGPAYRLARFVRRHWLLVAVAGLGLAGLSIGLFVAALQARRAEHRFQEVRRLARAMIFDLDERIAPLPGSTPARQYVVATSLSYLDGLLAEAGDDPELRRELAEAYERVGDVQGHPRSPNLGQPQAALRSYQQALSLRTGPGFPASVEEARGLARLRTRIADVQESEGRLDEARASLDAALRTLRPRAGAAPPDADARRLLIDALTSLGTVHARGNDAASALTAHQESLAVAEAWLREDPVPDARRAVAMAEARVANALMEQGDVDASLAGHRRAVAALDELARLAPDDAGLRRDLRIALSWLGNVQGIPGFLNAGDTEGAIASYRRVLELSRALTDADPRDARGQLDWLNACWRLASVLADSAPAESVALVEQARGALVALRAGAPDSFDLARRDAALQATLADALARSGQPARALAVLREARPAAEALDRRNPGDVAVRALRRSLLRREGDLLRAAGETAAARQAYEQALALAEAWVREKPGDLYARWALAESYAALGRIALGSAREARRPPASRREEARAAQAWLRRALAVWQEWPKHASTSVFDRTRRALAERELAEAERLLGDGSGLASIAVGETPPALPSR